jgi:hypothetical protein
MSDPAVTPLTDAQMAACKRSPDKFVGVVKHVPKGATKSPLDVPNFVYAANRRDRTGAFWYQTQLVDNSGPAGTCKISSKLF